MTFKEVESLDKMETWAIINNLELQLSTMSDANWKKMCQMQDDRNKIQFDSDRLSEEVSGLKIQNEYLQKELKEVRTAIGDIYTCVYEKINWEL